jgi:hypothetical protein
MVATQMRVVMVVTHIEPHGSQCYYTDDGSVAIVVKSLWQVNDVREPT